MQEKTLANVLKRKEFRKHEKIKQFTIDIYKESDFEGLMNLYENVFPHYMSKELWSWKNEQSPSGRYYTFLMKDNEQIIGAYSVAPREFSIYGKNCLCVQSLDTMTDQNYCGKGISTFLANLTYEYARLNGRRFVYGFPNNNSIYMFEKKLNWKNYGQINLAVKDLTRINKPIIDNTSFYIREVKFFTQEINEFWDDQKQLYPIIVEKTMDYLNWRYVEHPFVKYSKFIIYNNKTDEIVGYFILKKYKNKKESKSGHIVDFIIDQTKKSQKFAIIKIIESYASTIFKVDCCKISLWMPDHELAEYLVNKLSYKEIQTETYFGFRNFTNEFKQTSLLFYLDNWNFTMSDNDVF